MKKLIRCRIRIIKQVEHGMRNILLVETNTYGYITKTKYENDTLVCEGYKFYTGTENGAIKKVSKNEVINGIGVLIIVDNIIRKCSEDVGVSSMVPNWDF